MTYRLLKSLTLSPLQSEQATIIPQSIRLKEYVRINSSRQGMIIESENPTNPVLLFIHGGPGLPAYPLIKKSQLHLEKYFTVCYWDQRGTGMSYGKTNKQAAVTMDQLLDDTITVTDYLRSKFNQEKVYLFGHSWGTFLGSIAAGRHPERFHAYIGSGQIGNQLESEKETLSFLQRAARKKQDKQAIKQMQTLEIDDTYYHNEQYAYVLRKYLMPYGGAMFRRQYSHMKIALAYAFSDAYKVKEKINILRGMKNTSPLLRHLAEINLIATVPVINTPVFIIQGIHDYQTTWQQANAFYANLKAPKKNFYTFELSAHTPFIEEARRFHEIIESDILNIGHAYET